MNQQPSRVPPRLFQPSVYHQESLFRWNNPETTFHLGRNWHQKWVKTGGVIRQTQGERIFLFSTHQILAPGLVSWEDYKLVLLFWVFTLPSLLFTPVFFWRALITGHKFLLWKPSLSCLDNNLDDKCLADVDFFFYLYLYFFLTFPS